MWGRSHVAPTVILTPYFSVMLIYYAFDGRGHITFMTVLTLKVRPIPCNMLFDHRSRGTLCLGFMLCLCTIMYITLLAQMNTCSCAILVVTLYMYALYTLYMYALYILYFLWQTI